MNNIIMNPIDVHLFSSISTISSNAKVAIIPPITANTIRIQNSLSVSFFVADLSSKSSTVCLVSFGDILGVSGSVGGVSGYVGGWSGDVV